MKNLIILLALMLITINIDGKSVNGEVVRKFRELQVLTNCSFTVTSGYRSKAHNKRVGGATRSYHLKGHALDIVPQKGCNKPLSLIARYAIHAGFKGVIIYRDGHIHLDIRKKPYYRLGVK